MRLDKALAPAGLSRSDAKKAIRQGRVAVDGRTASDPGMDVEGKAVFLDGRPVEPDRPVHVMIHKPKGMVTAARDNSYDAIYELLSPEELNSDFEVVHEGYGNQLIENWREAHGKWREKPFFKASSMLSIHTYLTDPRCWGFVLSNTALQIVAAHPDTVTIRQVSPAPAPRVCNALILNAYPDENVIKTLLGCIEEYVEERPHLKKFPDLL